MAMKAEITYKQGNIIKRYITEDKKEIQRIIAMQNSKKNDSMFKIRFINK